MTPALLDRCIRAKSTAPISARCYSCAPWTHTEGMGWSAVYRILRAHGFGAGREVA